MKPNSTAVVQRALAHLGFSNLAGLCEWLEDASSLHLHDQVLTQMPQGNACTTVSKFPFEVPHQAYCWTALVVAFACHSLQTQRDPSR